MYFCDKNPEVLLSKLQICAPKPLEWFSSNYMKMNSDKCHIDYKINFHTHIENLYKKVGKKPHILGHAKYLSTNQAQILMKNFIKSQFSYRPLIWMRHSRRKNNQINKLHERSLKLFITIKSLLFGNFSKEISR